MGREEERRAAARNVTAEGEEREREREKGERGEREQALCFVRSPSPRRSALTYCGR